MNPQALLEENKQQAREITLLSQQLKLLEEQLAWFKRQLFGKKSERIIEHDDQFEFELGLEQPKPSAERISVPAHGRTKTFGSDKNKISFPEDLPVETKTLDLPEEEKVINGVSLVKIGEEVSQKLAHKPGSYFIKQTIRPKYALPEGQGIRVQELPDSIIPRIQVDESLLAEIFTKKFADHLPLYRIREGMTREGIGISKQLLSQWVLKCGKALEPLYQALIEEVYKSKAIFVDETPVNMQMPGRGKTHQGYMWVTATPTMMVYRFKKSRKHEHAAEILKGYRGVVHSDKYGAYEHLAGQKRFTWAPCFAHIRRKFVEAEGGDPYLRSWMLRKIRYLFLLEKVGWSRSEEERLRIRKELEDPIIDEIVAKVKEELVHGKRLPKSKMREALGYIHGLIPYLKNYTQHADARLDNNVAERSIRPLAIGRKNWLFVGSEKGGEAAAVLLSLVQTARANNVNPREYLEDVMRRVMSHNYKKLYELLPEQWAQARRIACQHV